MSHIRLHAAYIETGDRFLPKYPAHWTIKPSRSLLRVHKRVVGDRHAEYPLLSLTLDGIKVRNVDSGKGKFPESFDTYQEVTPGDLVFCLFDMDETPRTVGLSPHRGMITGAYAVFKPTPAANVDFLYYYFLHHDSQKSLKPYYTGLRKVIQKGTFGSIRIAAPEVFEQREIAEYLDRETTRIDSLIEKKTRFIELLKEKRQAVITNAVTKGLDPSAQTQESGVEWIGRIPANWSVRPLFSAAKEVYRSNKGMIESNLLSLSYGRVVRRDINAEEGLLPDSFETYQIIEDGEIVMRLTDLQNDQKSLRTALATERGIVTSAYVVIRPTDSLNSEYLAHLMRAYDIQKVFYSMGGGMRQSMKFSDLRRLPLLIPSLQEQKEICSSLHPKLARIDQLVSKTEQSIVLLKEQRSTLITAAVTGKIDVRNSK